MPAQPDIIKVFHEEPFFLEPLPPDEEPDARRTSTELGAIDALLPGDFAERPEPRSEDGFAEDALQRPRPYYRLYVAGSALTSGRVGATAIERPEAWAGPMRDLLGGHGWWAAGPEAVSELDADARLRALSGGRPPPAIVVADRAPFPESLRTLSTTPRRDAIGELKRTLEEATAVLFPESASHGFDWGVFSSVALVERFRALLRREVTPNVRIFVASYQKARSEERFYFERWALDALPSWVDEVRQDG